MGAHISMSRFDISAEDDKKRARVSDREKRRTGNAVSIRQSKERGAYHRFEKKRNGGAVVVGEGATVATFHPYMDVIRLYPTVQHPKHGSTNLVYETIIV